MRYIKNIVSIIFILINLQLVVGQDLKEDPNLIKKKLSNGLTYYIYKTDKTKDQAVFRLFIKTGSLQEENNQRGLAHFMEHMAFNGTEHFEGNEIVEFLENVGAKFGHDLNAHTSYHETIYKLNIPTKNKWVVDSTLTIMKDWANGISLDSLEIEKERGVVISEWLSKQNAKQKTQDAFLNILLNDSRYADRRVIGDTTTLRNFKRKALKNYYDKWYDPSLMAVAVAGDVNVNNIEKLIKQKFSSISSNQPKKINYKIKNYKKQNFITVTDEGSKKIELTGIRLIEPYRDLKTENDFLGYLKKNILNKLFRERLSNLSFDNPSYSSGSVSLGNYFPVKGALMTSLELKPNKIEEGIVDYYKNIKQIFKYGFTKNEIIKIKKQIDRQFENKLSSQESPSSSRMVQEMHKNFFYGNAIITTKNEFDLTKKYYQEIDSISLLHELKHIYKPKQNQYLLTASDKRKKDLPSHAELKRIFKKIENTDVKPYYRNMEVPDQLLEKKPVAGKIMGKRRIDAIDADEYQLSNGIRLIYKQSDLDKNTIILSGFRKGGLYSLKEEDYLSGIHSSPVISLSGYGNFTRDALSQYLAGNSAKATMLADKTRTGFYASSAIEDKKTLFELLYLKWTKLKIDEKLFNQIKDRTIQRKINDDPSPAALFGKEVKWSLRGKDYVTKDITAKRLEKDLKKDKLLEHYNHFFGNANGFTVLMISDRPFLELRDDIQNYLAALPSGTTDTDYKYFNRNNLNTNKSLVNKTGDSPKATVSLVFQQDFPLRSLDKVDIENDLIKGVLKIKLLKELREEMGAVYSVGVSASSTLHPSSLSRQTVSFVCEPDQVDILVEKTKSIIEEIAFQKVSFKKELAKVKTNLIKVDNLQRQRNTYWTKQVREHYFNEFHNWDAVLKYQERVKNVSEKTLSTRMKKYFIQSPKLEAVLMPKQTDL